MLPQVDRPKTKVTLPLSGKDGFIHPFTMKEQKVLLIAEQSEDEQEIISAISTIVDTCTTFKSEDITIPEFQWLFLQIRKFSVGSTTDVKLKCPHCKNETPATLSLDEFQISERTDVVKKVMIDDSVGIMLKEPTMKDVNSARFDMEAFIDYVFDENNVYKLTDESKEEAESYVESFPTNVIEHIVKFAESGGKFALHKDWNCISCGEKNTIHIEGIGSFFK